MMTNIDPTFEVSRDTDALLEVQCRIEPEWHERHGRSFAHAVRDRMCDDCQSKLGQEVEARVAVEDSKAKRVRFETRKGRYGDNPIAVVEECCSKNPFYRDPRLSLREVLFRVLLADGNRPKTILDMYNEVNGWVGYGDGRVITPEVIHHLVATDDHYGLVLVELEQETP